MITKLVILDRDGTINHDSDEYVKTAQEWTPMPGALEAIARLNHAGWYVVVASNHSGLGRGLFDVEAVQRLRRDTAAGRTDGSYSLLALVAIELWCRQFVDTPLGSRPG